MHQDLSMRTSIALDDSLNNNVIWIPREKTQHSDMRTAIPIGFLDELLTRMETNRSLKKPTCLTKEEEIARRLWGQWMLVNQDRIH